MKRLALLLGSLLVVSAAVSAKEVVPAPVVVEETPVQIIEKEVIVYRDREPEWRPSGFISLEETYYGKTEGDSYKHAKGWNAPNQYLRTQAEASINLTEKASMDIRGRKFAGTHTEQGAKPDHFRARFFYNHGTLGDSKVTAKSMVKYEKEGSGRADQAVELGVDFDFAAYMFSNDYVKTSRLAVGPRLSREWNDYEWKNKFGYVDSVGLYFNWVTELPFGFGTDFEIDSMAYGIGNKKGVFEKAIIENGKDASVEKKTAFVLPVKFILTHSYKLYANDDLSLDWYAEGGYDAFRYNNRGVVVFDGEPEVAERIAKKSYEVYFEPSVTLTYHATKFVDVFGKVGAKYDNWVDQDMKTASHWRWQPYAAVGVNAKF